MRSLPAVLGPLSLAGADLVVGVALYLSVSRIAGALLLVAGALVIFSVAVEGARTVHGETREVP